MFVSDVWGERHEPKSTRFWVFNNPPGFASSAVIEGLPGREERFAQHFSDWPHFGCSSLVSLPFIRIASRLLCFLLSATNVTFTKGFRAWNSRIKRRRQNVKNHLTEKRLVIVESFFLFSVNFSCAFKCETNLRGGERETSNGFWRLKTVNAFIHPSGGVSRCFHGMPREFQKS